MPFFDTGCEEGWRAALAEIAGAEWTTLVPGHGAPMTDWSYARRMRDGLEAYIAETRSTRAAGATLEQALERVQLDAIRSGFVAGVEQRRAGFEQYFRVPLIRRIWEELDGKPLS